MLKSLFKFSNVEKGKILNEIVNLDALKSYQDKTIPTKVIKEDANTLTDFIHPAIDASNNKNEQNSFLKLADMIRLFKKA